MTTIQTDNLVSLASMQRTGTLREALVLCCQIDVAESQIKTVGDSTYGRLRLEALTVWNTMLEQVGGDAEKLDLEAVRGTFEGALTVEENWLRSAECPFVYEEGKLPRKWVESKSQIGIAISNGFNFQADPEVGMSALRKFNKKVKDDAEKAAAQERARKAAASGNSPAAAPSEQPTNDDTPTGGASSDPAAQNPAAKIPVGGTALSEAQLELLSDVMQKLDDVASVKGNGAIEGILKSLKTQVDSQHRKIAGALSKLANVG